MPICDYEHCDNDAEFIDDSDNYVCKECMERSLSENEYCGQTAEDFESLDWNKYPKLGFPSINQSSEVDNGKNMS